MKYRMFDGDNDGSFYVINCENVEGLRKAVDYFKSLGYDCEQIRFSENVVPNIIVRTYERTLLPCGASMSSALKNQGIAFKPLSIIKKDFISGK
jgi:hypothetical protein